MRYIEAPATYDGPNPSLFLAGGISGTDDWQNHTAGLLAPTDWVLLNPRRRVFPQGPRAAEEQIRWEFAHLGRAAACLFWFPSQTLCPIALYELGAWSRSCKPLFIGVDPDYQRRLDVRVQLSLARPDVTVVASLKDLAAAASAYLGYSARKEQP